MKKYPYASFLKSRPEEVKAPLPQMTPSTANVSVTVQNTSL